MWTCQKCGEDIDDATDACWNCGTSNAGVEDPAFQREDAPGVDDQTRSSSECRLDEEIACRTCGCKLSDLHRDSVCSECGPAVNWSPHGDLLRFSDPAWVRTLASGSLIRRGRLMRRPGFQAVNLALPPTDPEAEEP